MKIRNTLALSKSDVPHPPAPSPRGGGDRGNRPFLVFSHRSTDTGSVVAYFESAKVLRKYIIFQLLQVI
jgi:hypothetical protein